ncbi:hypothetical protein CPI84_19485 (plasmid) [Erwinia pyrifoliae]|nr:hypothetical protein CPI84_19295 [Erwinia pyrifoliae]AUX74608.1 hypothetical protein CPI84_19485 [Erwinia pyrifoliae]MCA8878317.1 hypothetical protein [Erwinia pyrifoliae]
MTIARCIFDHTKMYAKRTLARHFFDLVFFRDSFVCRLVLVVIVINFKSTQGYGFRYERNAESIK